jgi:uncharacterized protein YacL
MEAILNIIRLIYILIVALATYTLSDIHGMLSVIWAGLGALVLIGLLFFMDIRFHHRRTGKVLAGMGGMAVGLFTAKLIVAQIVDPLLVSRDMQEVSPAGLLLVSIVFGYMGILIGKGSMGELRIFNVETEEGGRRLLYVVDQDALVDGRIVKLCGTPALPGEIVVPRFVVDALEGMTATGDQVQRFRGRRGLENLRAMEREQGVRLFVREIVAKPGQESRSLIDYAREHGATLITKDSELEKQAQRSSVPVMNFNTLSDHLAPEVLQGDELVIKLVKPGKETDQAVGYLENGNMVVVENARKEIGKTVRITVTGIHQTKAGTLVFAQLKD